MAFISSSRVSLLVTSCLVTSIWGLQPAGNLTVKTENSLNSEPLFSISTSPTYMYVHRSEVTKPAGILPKAHNLSKRNQYKITSSKGQSSCHPSKLQ